MLFDKTLCCLSPIRITKAIRIPVRVTISIELPYRLTIRRDRVDGQEHPQLRIHVPLLHVAQPSFRITHMSRIPRAISNRRTYDSAIRLVSDALDHVAIGITFGYNRA